jgi:hypothetical protein
MFAAATVTANAQLTATVCFIPLCLYKTGAVVEALSHNRKVAGSIPNSVIGIFH